MNAVPIVLLILKDANRSTHSKVLNPNSRVLTSWGKCSGLAEGKESNWIDAAFMGLKGTLNRILHPDIPNFNRQVRRSSEKDISIKLTGINALYILFMLRKYTNRTRSIFKVPQRNQRVSRSCCYIVRTQELKAKYSSGMALKREF